MDELISYDDGEIAPAPISVLIPAHNEVGNIATLLEKVGNAFAPLQEQGHSCELVLVDDGSGDGTAELAASLAPQYPFLRLFRHRRNLGLTAALRTGFREVRGDVIIFLPADLESDPEEDIPKLLDTLTGGGYDVVAGWRQGRADGKVFSSGIYNIISGWLFDVNVHDMNWIKAFRSEVIEAMPPLRSDWHRYLLHIAADMGFSIGEVPTNWYPRQSGSSKFGLSRIPISFLDVLVVRFLLSFSQAPMRFFGGLGLILLGASGITYLYLLMLWLSRGAQRRPIFIAAGVALLAGLVLVLIGFITEMIVSHGERLTELQLEVRALRDEQRRLESAPKPSTPPVPTEKLLADKPSIQEED
ncbi:MAG: glycosyltransferase family 2 protein [Chloroflexota bacterium]|nr:glycosyltransferase family 2 protein [Chloroflexota bacterium]